MHDFFAFSIRNQPCITLHLGFNFMNLIGYHIKSSRGYYLDVEFLLRAYVEAFGAKDVIYMIDSLKRELLWEAEDTAKLSELLEQLRTATENSSSEKASMCQLI
jgi:hypothetical protein